MPKDEGSLSNAFVFTCRHQTSSLTLPLSGGGESSLPPFFCAPLVLREKTGRSDASIVYIRKCTIRTLFHVCLPSHFPSHNLIECPSLVNMPVGHVYVLGQRGRLILSRKRFCHLALDGNADPIMREDAGLLFQSISAKRRGEIEKASNTLSPRKSKIEESTFQYVMSMASYLLYNQF